MVANVIAQQYPHYLYVLCSEEATRAANGDMVAGRSRWRLWGRCREETNGKGAEIATSDMRVYKFAALVQCPTGTRRVPEGTMCCVADKGICADINTQDAFERLQRCGTIRIAAKCAKFDQGRLHCRLWL